MSLGRRSKEEQQQQQQEEQKYQGRNLDARKAKRREMTTSKIRNGGNR